MEELEMKKILDLRKREKEEERQARIRVKRLIEDDKLARKGIDPDSVQKVEVASEVKTPAVIATPKDYTSTKIQVILK